MKTQLGGVERLEIHAPISARAACRFRDRSQIFEIGCRHPHPIEREQQPLASAEDSRWEGLAMQFGGDYTRLRDFRRKFAGRLRLVTKLYPDARVVPSEAGLRLSPSWPSIPPLQGR
jgi:hypothetical protein